MIKLPINMVGGGFQHSTSSSGYEIPKLIEWRKDLSADISIHIDEAISSYGYERIKFAWIAESSAIVPHVIEYVKSNYNELIKHYKFIFTHDKRLLSIGDRIKFVIPNAYPWVQDKKIHNKTKLVSMIVSNKSGLYGYNYRLEWRDRMAKTGKVDIYGRGINPIEKKEYGLNEYMFSFAMENSNYPSAFCEKITDCFATGTIPIFWGTEDIGEYFNLDGIIILNDSFDINSLTPELYYSKMDAIKDNFERAINLPTSEDYMYLNYLKNF
jgi:hypothetical protein